MEGVTGLISLIHNLKHICLNQHRFNMSKSIGKCDFFSLALPRSVLLHGLHSVSHNITLHFNNLF